MRIRFSRPKALPAWLCYVLAAVLVLNGAFAPLGMVQPSAKLHTLAMESHCHHHIAAQPDTAQSRHGTCPCFGGVCHCGCANVFAIPTTFLDMRPIIPQRFIAIFILPQPAAVRTGRLLRPPIA